MRARAKVSRERSIERARSRHAQAAEARKRELERARERREGKQRERRANLARARHERDVSLVDLVDRLLAGGVVIHGDITLAVADVDLVYVGLRVLIASVESVDPHMGSALPAGRDES
jgi:hypothetical protein